MISTQKRLVRLLIIFALIFQGCRRAIPDAPVRQRMLALRDPLEAHGVTFSQVESLTPLLTRTEQLSNAAWLQLSPVNKSAKCGERGASRFDHILIDSGEPGRPGKHFATSHNAMRCLEEFLNQLMPTMRELTPQTWQVQSDADCSKSLNGGFVTVKIAMGSLLDRTGASRALVESHGVAPGEKFVAFEALVSLLEVEEVLRRIGNLKTSDHLKSNTGTEQPAPLQLTVYRANFAGYHTEEGVSYFSSSSASCARVTVDWASLVKKGQEKPVSPLADGQSVSPSIDSVGLPDGQPANGATTSSSEPVLPKGVIRIKKSNSVVNKKLRPRKHLSITASTLVPTPRVYGAGMKLHPTYPGLWNFGNNCYADAVLQTLFYIAPLRALVAECATRMAAFDPSTMPNTHLAYMPEKPYLSPVLNALFEKMRRFVGHGGVVGDELYRVLSVVSKKHPDDIVMGRQEDAGEFLVKVISDLENEMMATELIQRFNALVKADATKTTFWGPKDFDTVRARLFLKPELRQGSRSKTEPSLTNLALNMPIPPLKGGKSPSRGPKAAGGSTSTAGGFKATGSTNESKEYFDLVDLFKFGLFAPERLSEEEAVFLSDKSKTKVRAWTKVQYTSWPQTLIITLGRFEADALAGAPIKNDVAVHYPLVLDLSEFGSPSTYRLHAAVIHSGGASGGHYYSYVNLPGPVDVARSGDVSNPGIPPAPIRVESAVRFHEFDDATVTEVDTRVATERYFGWDASIAKPGLDLTLFHHMAEDRITRLSSSPQELAFIANGRSHDEMMKHLEVAYAKDFSAVPCAYILVYVRTDVLDAELFGDLQNTLPK